MAPPHLLRRKKSISQITNNIIFKNPLNRLKRLLLLQGEAKNIIEKLAQTFMGE